jgi:endonuclease/exonuclease/phosphatase family metal-dependent hydrolase
MRHLGITTSLVAFCLALAFAGCAHKQHRGIFEPATAAKTTYSIRLGSWNVKKLGHGGNKNYDAIAGVIEKNFDILALIEVMQRNGGHPGYDELMSKLGSGWTGQIAESPRPATTSGNSEFYAIIWRTSAVRACSGWAGLRYQKDNDGGQNGTGPDNFVRESAFGCYEYGPVGTPAGDFLLAGYHATFQGDAAIKAEVGRLGDVSASMQAARPGEKDLMIVGDFNRVPSQIATLLPSFADRTSGSGSTLNTGGDITANLYDHIMVRDQAATTEMRGDAVVLDVRSMASSPSAFYTTVSDHLPIVVELKSSADDD